MSPLVSVCMISYNHAPFIEQAIQSVLAQRRDFSLELIVSDDGSSDETAAIIARLAARHPSVIKPLPAGPNVGMMPNFVRALNACSGDYVALLEGDDYWLDERKLQKQVNMLGSRPDCSICFHRTEWRNDKGGTVHVFPDFQVPQPLRLRNMLTLRNVMNTSSIMFRRNAIGQLPPGFDSLEMGDYPLQILLARSGDAAYIPEVMSVYRIHAGGVWSTLSSAQSDARFARTFEWLLPHLPAADQALGAALNEFVQMMAQLQLGEDKGARRRAWRRIWRAPWGKQSLLSLAVLVSPRWARHARYLIRPDSKIHRLFR